MWIESLAVQEKLAQKTLEKERAKVAAEAKKNSIAKAKLDAFLSKPISSIPKPHRRASRKKTVEPKDSARDANVAMGPV